MNATSVSQAKRVRLAAALIAFAAIGGCERRPSIPPIPTTGPATSSLPAPSSTGPGAVPPASAASR
jgi:hypothetical protein